jgi:hypothetical protein
MAKAASKAPPQPPVEPPEDQTITIQDYVPRTPPGAISMADTLEELEDGAPQPPTTPYPHPEPQAYAPHNPTVLDGEILSRDTDLQTDLAGARYEGRIRILEAYQYPGAVHHAPGWIDRNWVAFADWDPVRNIEAGPALRVPTARGDTALARLGDYVVKQEVILAVGIPADVQIDVWPKDQFEKYFIRVSSS